MIRKKLNKTPKLVDYIIFYPQEAQTPQEAQPSNGGQSSDKEINCNTPCPNLVVTSEVAERLRKETIAHEIGHAVGLNHHGDKELADERILHTYESDRLVYEDPTDQEKETKERPYTICCPIGGMQGQSSGSYTCIMRYNNLYLWRYEVIGGKITYYKDQKDPSILTTFCTSDAGGTNPFGDAAEGKGNCLGRLRVKDY